MATDLSAFLAALKLDEAGSDPLYRRLLKGLETAIREGRIRLGSRLPSERALAEALGVSRTTITAAYRELEALGLVRGHVGRGTTVIADDPAARPAAVPWTQRAARTAPPIDTSAPPVAPDAIPFADGWLHASLTPQAALMASLSAVTADPTAALAPAPVAGLPDLRAAIADLARPRGLAVSPQHVLVTSGAQLGLNVVARALLSPGDVVVCETPTWHGAVRAFRSAGAEVAGVPMDGEGIDPDALEDAVARLRPKLVYLIPSFHCPTGRQLGLERRRRIVEVCARLRTPILESEVYAELALDAPPLPSLMALDEHGVVLQQASASKTVGGSLRLGWLIAPPGVMAQLVAAKASLDLSTPTLTQAMLADFLRERWPRHLPAFRAALRERRDRLAGALRSGCPDLRFQTPAGGLYIWARLPEPLRAQDIQARALAAGVTVRAGDIFLPEGGASRHVRLCFASPAAGDIETGAERLGVALASALKAASAEPARGSAYAAV